MVSLLEKVTELSSVLLRFCAYAFLRWVCVDIWKLTRIYANQLFIDTRPC